MAFVQEGAKDDEKDGMESNANNRRAMMLMNGKGEDGMGRPCMHHEGGALPSGLPKAH